MPKPSGVLERSPEALGKPLTDDEKTEIQERNENLNWEGTPPPEAEDPNKSEAQKQEEVKAAEDKAAKEQAEKNKDDQNKDEVITLTDDEQKAKDEETATEEKVAQEEKAETDRLDAKAKELDKTVDEVKQIEVDETKAEDERIAKKAEEEKKTVEEIIEAEKVVADEKTEQERLEVIAKEDGITVDEVKAAEEKDTKVVENYSKDPMQMARALRKENSAYGKLKSENDKLVDYKKNIEVQQKRYNEKAIDGQLETNKDKIVEEYIKLNPDDASVEADVLFERAKVTIKEALKSKDEETGKELKDEADKARETIIESIPEEYKEYVPEIKETLKESADMDVTSKGFDVLNLCYWARGKKMTPEHVKSLEEAAEKRGKEQPEIIAKKTAATSSGDRSTQKGTKSSVVASASDKDKERALELNANKEMTDEKKIEYYMTEQKKSDNWD